jgi:hypothetical protein
MSDALSGPVGDLPDEAVEAAAKAVARAFGWGEDHFTAERVQHYSRYAGPALAAALPLIRAHIADELDEQANHEAPNAAEALRFAAGQIAAGLPQLHAVVSARRAAARVARGGTDGTEETK